MKLKEKIYIVVGMVMGMILSATVSYTVASTLINSKDVVYQDNSGLGATNVQAAIDGTCTKFNTQLTTLQTTIESNVDKKITAAKTEVLTSVDTKISTAKTEVNNSTDTKITTAKSDTLLKAYPVGSIYISTSATNPGSLIGGTWVAWGTGKVPVGINTSDTDFNTVEKTGGAKEHRHIGESAYAIINGTHYVGITNTKEFINRSISTFFGAQVGVRNVTVTGQGQSTEYYTSYETNLQPYITCYMWKRTK